jgi:hypothetical protein
MLRATGYRRPMMQWPRRRQFPAGATFALSPLRLAAATAVAGLLLGNVVLVYELTREDAGPVRHKTTLAPGLQSEASDLQSALEAVEAETKADVGRLTVRYGEPPDRRSRSEETPARGGAASESPTKGDGTSSVSAPTNSSGSTGSSTGSTSGGSDTGTGSGGSSGGSPDSGDTTDGSTSGSSGGSSSGSSGGGAGGGGGSDTGGSGDVSGSGGSGGGGG